MPPYHKLQWAYVSVYTCKLFITKQIVLDDLRVSVLLYFSGPISWLQLYHSFMLQNISISDEFTFCQGPQEQLYKLANNQVSQYNVGMVGA